MTPDSALLRQYAEQGDEAAFAEVVRRHVKFVYASAVRLLNGDLALAQDVSQMVFNDLARKANQMGKYDTVAGWLHTSVRFAALSAIRTEQRRRNREHEASAMSDTTLTLELSWSQLRPLIDEALSQLPTAERDIILLRFFEEKSHREIGEALGLNENTARMRVERAVEKLRAFFARHGVKTTAALLTTTLSAQPITPLPAGFATAVAGKSLAGATAAGAASGQSARLIATKSKAVLVGTAVLATAAASTIIFYRPAQNPALAQKSPIVAAASVAPTTQLSTLPKPTMNTSQILSAGTLASALLTTTPVLAQVATSIPAPELSQPNKSILPANSVNINIQGTPSPSATDTPTISLDTPPPAIVTGVATWTSGHSPVLVDTTGVLKDKIITAIASSGGSTPHWLVLCSDGTLASWGENYAGQLGIGRLGKSLSTTVPVLVDMKHELLGKTVTGIAAYGNYSLALTSDGAAYVWGTNGHILAESKFIRPTYQSSPQQVTGFTAKKAIAIAAGSTPMFLCSDGSLYTLGEWGYRGHVASPPRTLQGVPPNQRLLPHPAIFDKDTLRLHYDTLKIKGITAIASGTYHFVALFSDGTVAFWGHLHNLQPGQGLYTNGYDPVVLNVGDVFKGKTITTLGDGGGDRLMALCSDGTLAIWQDKAIDAPLPPDSPFLTAGERIYDYSNNRNYRVAPIVVNTSDGLLKGKAITAIASAEDSMVMLCTDGTIAQWDLKGKLEAVDTSGVLKGKKILAISPGMVLFSVPADQIQDGSPDISIHASNPTGTTDPTSPTNTPPAFKPLSL